MIGILVDRDISDAMGLQHRPHGLPDATEADDHHARRPVR